MRRMRNRAAGRQPQHRRSAQQRPDLTPAKEADLLARLAVLEQVERVRPDVTVIIAAYNVADYLEFALESALKQTLRNLEVLVVDDHSTDATLEVAVEHAEADSRVRVLRTEENSGGPGVPRNLGIQSARAPHYTFLDGDDTLEPHACKVLLEEAERTGADLVVGRSARFHVSTGKSHEWYGHLFSRGRTLEHIDEFPELFNDTIAAGKLYRRSFTVDADNWLLEGVHYEDLVFTARAYAEASRIAIVPATTYLWHVYPEDERKSITAHRDDLSNLEHRLAALTLVDEAVAASNCPEMRKEIKRKFFKHDARIYLNQALSADDDWLTRTCELIRPRLESYSDADWQLTDVRQHLVYGSVLSGNLEGIRQSILFTTRRSTLGGHTVLRNGRRYWQPAGCDPQLPDPESRAAALLDVTDTFIWQVPPRAAKPRHTVTSISVGDRSAELHGTSDSLTHWYSDEVEHCLVVRLRKSTTEYRMPIRFESVQNGMTTWTARWTLPNSMPMLRPQIWDFFFESSDDLFRTRMPLLVSGFEPQSVPQLKATGATGSLFNRAYEWYRTASGDLALKLRAAAGRQRSVDLVAAGTAAGAAAGGRLFRDRFRRAADKFSRSYAYEQLRRLPIDDTAVFCESMLGKSAWDSPRYVAEEVLRLRPDLTVYWVHQGHDAPSLPDGFVPVRRWSPEYFRHAATAKYIIDNQTLPEFFRKRRQQCYLQTWHGIPLKTMGLDSPDVKYSFQKNRQSFVDRAAAWDGLVSPCDYFERTFVNAYRYTGELLRGGTPRNDVLVRDADDREKYKRRLGLPLDRTIVLYAPTFRNTKERPDAVSPRSVIDMEAWARARGKDSFLLVRAHYLDNVSIPASFAHMALDVSKYPNVNDLYLAADVLVTDYSSVMFDYATLGRPIILFPYDYDAYVNDERGTYVDILDYAAGPLVHTFDELIDAVPKAASDLTVSTPEYRRFVDELCGDEDGLASERAAAFLLGLGRREEG